VKQQNL